MPFRRSWSGSSVLRQGTLRLTQEFPDVDCIYALDAQLAASLASPSSNNVETEMKQHSPGLCIDRGATS